MSLILYLFLELRWEDKEMAYFLSSYLLKTVTILHHYFRVRGRENFSEDGCESLVSPVLTGGGSR